MKRTFVWPLLSLVLFTSVLLADGPTPYPNPKDPSAWPGKGPIRLFNWMDGHRQRFWKARTTDQGKIVFVGDSIVENWKINDLFPGKPVANRGIGGDVSRGVLFRFQEDVLDLHPKAIVLEIGSNDISADGKLDELLFNINAILDLAHNANPATPVILCAIPPKGIPTDGPKAVSPELAMYLKRVYANVPKANAELAKIPATRTNVRFVDFYTPLLLSDGNVNTALFSDDQVHPNTKAYEKLTAILMATLTDVKAI